MTITADTPSWIALDGAVNARVVVPGVLLRSDNLQQLSAGDVRELIEVQRLKVVLDLRTESEIALEGPGPLTREPAVRIEHRSLYPAVVTTGIDPTTLSAWDDAKAADIYPDEAPVVRGYMRYLQRRPDSIVGSLQTIAHSDGAVLVHCAAGKDRTGLIVAMALAAAGHERDAIAGDYMATASRIEQIIARLSSSATYRDEIDGADPQRYAPPAGTIERLFELLDQEHGGALAWLAQHGLSDGDLAALRTRLR